MTPDGVSVFIVKLGAWLRLSLKDDIFQWLQNKRFWIYGVATLWTSLTQGKYKKELASNSGTEL